MEKINGLVFRGMLESGCNHLNNRKKEVDALNVFPVPDGDTGTNMSLTFTNGVNEVAKSGSESLSVIAKTLQRGLLMGARGNSGVILSQIFRGFYQAVKEKEELTTADLSEAMLSGSKRAYKAVMRPVEGTILTVIRESTDAAAAALESDPEMSVEAYIDLLCAEAKKSVDHTPELLPVLKEAHCVDSGGTGLLLIFEGFRASLHGTPFTADEKTEVQAEEKSPVASGYRTEYILKFNDHGMKSFREERFRKSIEQLGNKITLITDEDGVRLRLNTMTPGEILMLGQRYGDFVKVQIENIQDDLNPSIIDETEVPVEEKEYGIIAVAAGEGLQKLFKDYRCDVVVSGGQTMNPSTQDFIDAVSGIHARHIYILPNNSNIIMAAKQAAHVTEDKDIIVIETKSILQGISSCIVFNPDDTPETNTASMLDAVAHVRSGSVTYAIKDTTVDGREIHAGDYMSILEHDIIQTDRDMVQAAIHLVDAMCDEDSEIVTVIRGKDASEEQAEELVSYISEKYEVDVDLQDGGQPVYSFFIGVE